MEKKEEYCIIKLIKQGDGKPNLPVIILDSDDSIKDFTDKQKAIDFVKFLEKNSDSGHKFYIEKI